MGYTFPEATGVTLVDSGSCPVILAPGESEEANHS